MNRFIAVVGKMHSGKTTLAGHLQTLGFTRMAFADPVKDAAADMLNALEARIDLSKPTWYDRDTINQQKMDPAIRRLLQLVGTELGRKRYGEDVWVHKLEQLYWAKRDNDERQGFHCLIVNDDCRFPNEAASLRELDFIVVKLLRNEEERRESIIQSMLPQYHDDRAYVESLLPTIFEHESETNVDLIEADFTIASLSVEQLNWIARELSDPYFTYDAYTRLNAARNRQLGLA